MAYIISKGLVNPKKVDQNEDDLIIDNPLPIINYNPIAGSRTIPISSCLQINAKVIRKIRPNDIGIVERIIADGTGKIISVLVKFFNVTHSLPYSATELEEVLNVNDNY